MVEEVSTAMTLLEWAGLVGGIIGILAFIAYFLFG